MTKTTCDCLYLRLWLLVSATISNCDLLYSATATTFYCDCNYVRLLVITTTCYLSTEKYEGNYLWLQPKLLVTQLCQLPQDCDYFWLWLLVTAAMTVCERDYLQPQLLLTATKLLVTTCEWGCNYWGPRQLLATGYVEIHMHFTEKTFKTF